MRLTSNWRKLKSRKEPEDRQEGLGSLSRLPPEVRLEIWKLFSLDIIQSEKVEHKLAFLRTSRGIHQEASNVLYRNLDLTLHVDPFWCEDRWLTMQTNGGMSRVIKGFKHAEEIGFARFPFDRVRKIEIKVAPSDYYEPGGFVCLWYRCFGIAALLSHAKGRRLRRLEITFERETEKWRELPWVNDDSESCRDHLGGWESMSCGWYNPGSGIRDARNYVKVLKAFSRLRNIASAAINLPPPFTDDHSFASRFQDVLARDYRRTTEEENKKKSSDDPWSDVNVERQFERLRSDLDKKWISMPGYCARHMRCNNFSLWSQQWEHLIHSSGH